MSSQIQPLDELVRQLPAESQAEVRDFVENLLARSRRKSGGMLKQDWAGGLSDLRSEFTSLELQNKSLDWRGD
jgi:hypothetical protein